MKRTRYLLTPFSIALLIIGIVFFALRYECYQANAGGVGCFKAFEPISSAVIDQVQQRMNVSWRFIRESSRGGAYLIGVIAAILLFCRRLPLWLLLYLAAVSLSCVGEYFEFSRATTRMMYAHLASFLCALIAFFLKKDTASDRVEPQIAAVEPIREVATRFSWMEAVLLVFFGAVMISMRFYDINFNPEAWDAETCPHRAIATSWNTILQQELGEHIQQSSGFAWVALHNLFTRLEHPTLFDLDQRMLSVAISFINLTVVYFTTRSLFGVFTAFLSLVAIGFGPLEFDWARQPTLHHLPVLIGLLMLWFSVTALTQRSWLAFVGILLTIVMTKFVYPSAKTIAVGPFLAMFGVMLFDRKQWLGEKRKWLVVILGGMLYFVSRTLIYYFYHGKLHLMTPVPMIQPAQTDTTLLMTAQKLLGNATQFFEEIYHGPVESTHWTNHATIIPVRSLPSFCVVFCTVAIARLICNLRNPATLLLVGLLIGGLIPGVATGMAERRIAFALILMTILACREFGWLCEKIVAPRIGRKATLPLQYSLLLGFAVVLCGFQMFSMYRRPTGPSVQLQATNVVRPLVTEGTLLVYLADERRCEMFYGIFDELKDGKGTIGFATPYDERRGLREIVENPTPSVNSWYYRSTVLGTYPRNASWKRVLFVYPKAPHRKEFLPMLEQLYPQGALRSYPFTDMYRRTLMVYDVPMP